MGILRFNKLWQKNVSISQGNSNCLSKRANKDEDDDEENATNGAENHPRTEMGSVVAQKDPEGVGWFFNYQEIGTNLKEILVQICFF